MTTLVHTETCPKCGGSGYLGPPSPIDGIVVLCNRCHGSGRVPVPVRGITDPDEHDLAKAALERRLGIATQALELIVSDSLHRCQSPTCETSGKFCSWCEANADQPHRPGCPAFIAASALEELSK